MSGIRRPAIRSRTKCPTTHGHAARFEVACDARKSTRSTADDSRYSVTETAYRTFAVGRASNGLRSAWAPLPVRSRSTTLERTAEARQAEVLTTYDLHDRRTPGYGLPTEVREIGHGRRGVFSTPHEQQQAETIERFTRTTYVNLDEPEPADERAPYRPSYIVGNTGLRERVAVTSSGDVLVGRSRWFYDGEPYKGLGYPGSGTVVGVTRGTLSSQIDLAFTALDFEAAFPPSSGAAAARDERGGYLRDGDDHYVHAARMAYAANGLPIGSVNARGHETTVEYDVTHSLFPVRVTEPLLPPVVLERGVLPFRLAAIVDPNGNRTEFTYDPTGWPASKAVMGKLVGGEWQGDPPSHPTERYEYDFAAIPIRVTTEKRQTRLGTTLDTHTYIDGLGRTVQERHTAEPDPAAPHTPRFRVTGAGLFNHKGLLVRAYQPTFAASSGYAPAATSVPSVETVHDALGRPIRVTFPDETYETTDYHPWVQTASDRNDNADDPLMATSRYAPYLSAFEHHVNTPTRRFVDAFGRAIAVAADNGSAVHVTRRGYDTEDRVTEIWDGRGLPVATWTFQDDRAGRHTRTEHRTALGDRRALTDAAGNPIWALDARGTEVHRFFDALDRPLSETSVHDGRPTLRRRWRYVAYDPSDPALASYMSRNLFGRIEERRDADGLRVFEYDWRGLVTSTSARFWRPDDVEGRGWDDPASDVWTRGAEWDPPIPDGERDSITSFLELPDLDTGAALDIDTTYDAAGRATETRYPGGMRIRRGYNAAGFVDVIEVDQGAGLGYQPGVADSAYSARGHLTQLTHGNGVETRWNYDPELERLTRIVSTRTSAPATVVQDRSYAYDPAGNPLAITDHLTGASSLPDRIVPNTRTFRYDPRYRLIEATGTRHRAAADRDADVLVSSPEAGDYEPYVIAYACDAAGHCTRNEEYAAGVLHYKADRVDLFNGDEAEAAESSDPAAGSYRYDANGNTTRTPRQEALAYTHDNQVRYIQLAGGTQVRDLRHGDQRVLRLSNRSDGCGLSLTLGPFEYRVRRGVAGCTTLTLHVLGHGRHAQAERLLAGTDAGSVPLFFHHGDHLESAHVLTATDGSAFGQEEYFPYGRASDRREARNRHRFLGVERDEDTLLCMTGPRAYDPVTGRFLQGDPAAPTEHATAPFVYGDANPVSHTDPNGYQTVVLPGPEGLLLDYLELYQEFFAQGVHSQTLDLETGVLHEGAPFCSQEVTMLARQRLEAPISQGGFGVARNVSDRVLQTVSDPILSREFGGPFSVLRRPSVRSWNATLTPPPRPVPPPLRTPTLPGGGGGTAAAVVRTPTVVPEAAATSTSAAASDAVTAAGEAVGQGLGESALRTTLTGFATGLGIGLVGEARHNDVPTEPEFVLVPEFLKLEFWDLSLPAGDLFKWERNPNYKAWGSRNNDAAGGAGYGVEPSVLP